VKITRTWEKTLKRKFIGLQFDSAHFGIAFDRGNAEANCADSLDDGFSSGGIGSAAESLEITDLADTRDFQNSLSGSDPNYRVLINLLVGTGEETFKSESRILPGVD
jgi:hypothetical protein